MCRQRSVLGILGVWSLANGRLECPNKRGLCAGKGQAAMLERWRPGAWWKLPRGMCRQRAGCNPGAAKADGQAWWKLPRRNWRVLGVVGLLGVWSLANGRLECLNLTREGYVQAKEGFRRFRAVTISKSRKDSPVRNSMTNYVWSRLQWACS